MSAYMLDISVSFVPGGTYLMLLVKVVVSDVQVGVPKKMRFGAV